jgi:hypothetical protein
VSGHSPPWPLYLRGRTLVCIEQECSWAPELVWTFYILYKMEHFDARRPCHGSGSLSPWRPGFNTRPVCVGFVMNKVAWGQCFPVSVISQTLCICSFIHSFIRHHCYIISVADGICLSCCVLYSVRTVTVFS